MKMTMMATEEDGKHLSPDTVKLLDQKSLRLTSELLFM
jgi:hypothetical protein